MPEIQSYFGRRRAPDERDRLFPMRLMLDPLRSEFFPEGIPAGYRHYFAGSVLDQGATGTCVAQSWTSKVHAAPIMQQLPVSTFDYYRRIVAIDEWVDNDGEASAPDHMLQSGTSVRAGAKVLVDMGLAQTYLWAESASDVRAWIMAGFGGVVIGIYWLTGMMQTDTSGFLSATGGSVGGHAVYLNGWNDRVKRNGVYVPAARGQNSWGTGWGQKGRFWITQDDLDKMLRLDGEACALTEKRVSRA